MNYCLGRSNNHRGFQQPIRHYSKTFLVTLAFFVILLPSPMHSQGIKGSCKDTCDEQRPKGHKQSFKFNCDTAYKSGRERNRCRESCESCPKEVCDETISKDSANLWHCPSTEIDGECKDFCSNNRPKGKREKYDIKTPQGKSCSSSYSLHCPPFVCGNNDLVHCPDESIDDECRTQCDKIREAHWGDIAWLDPFNFTCDTEYSDPNDQQSCRENCGKCPKWVCDVGSSSPIVYHCPVAEMSDYDCQKFCDKYRPAGSSEPYKMDCQDKLEECKEECEDCDVFACNETNPISFNCPQPEPENPTPEGQISYKGPCKDRCENSRGGGYEAFKLDCNKIFKTDEETESCKWDCAECPEEVCKNSDNILHCKADQKELDKENERKQQEREEQEEKLDDIYEERINAIIWFVVIYVIIIAITGTYWACRKWAHKKAVKDALAYNQPEQQESAISTVQQPNNMASQVQIQPLSQTELVTSQQTEAAAQPISKQ